MAITVVWGETEFFYYYCMSYIIELSYYKLLSYLAAFMVAEETRTLTTTCWTSANPCPPTPTTEATTMMEAEVRTLAETMKTPVGTRIPSLWAGSTASTAGIAGDYSSEEKWASAASWLAESSLRPVKAHLGELRGLQVKEVEVAAQPLPLPPVARQPRQPSDFEVLLPPPFATD